MGSFAIDVVTKLKVQDMHFQTWYIGNDYLYDKTEQNKTYERNWSTYDQAARDAKDKGG